MILGCSTYVLEGRDLDTALTEISRAGFKVVELCSYSRPEMFQSYQVGEGEQYAEDLRDRVEDFDLEVAAIVAYANPLEREGWEFIVGALELAHDMRVGTVVTLPGRSEQPGALEAAIEAFRTLAGEAESRAVRLGIKTHDGMLAYSTPTSLDMVRGIGSPWVGITIDPSHFWRAGEQPEGSVRRLREHLFTCSVRDTEARTRQGLHADLLQQVPGRGRIDLPAFCQEVQGIPGIRYMSLDMAGMRNYPLERLRELLAESRAYLERCLEG
jgi:sugar phosphate isomerase/epimerase